ncbi:phosphate ABC transporter membrane protein 2, PhoT family (TC 3.A.1.7.1) [Peptoclostridium litorale DSM 5388]|uniref:Phosphate transport system permease protein PstA n=1 Tax=Peptoclostridium litorale DSM 5388 TaxID=1121324 RepID=A0A069REQ9_PEPLI|nr:phosphate ABC transporter permease PstA [Peptoclostridium litorale]KDR93856.1 phosphate ABC transporter, inner membrane subunit PstA [Peptoclostridium litorale DSM 5388]KDR95283.1 phosphate ABC transporter, inner membrane subunit PstA [Peptoclostridium litorale DSM 5388]SIN87229.1 phosphate ABC transporter membrane protein 2, PhoT family (TC 3.A.1.7.1) [Peptoclostridium litorale DSM 5388]
MKGIESAVDSSMIKGVGSKSNIMKRRMQSKLFEMFFFGAIMFGIMMLMVLMANIIKEGIGWLDIDFITSFPSRFAKKAGIKSALVGSIWVMSLTFLFSFPLGVGTAIYLEEYSDKKKRFNKILQVNIANLAGVPSIVYGILGLAVFVRFMGFERSIISGALTLGLLILPVIIVSSQEALKSVPNELRHGAYAIGVSKWQTITGVVLPYALPGILTGTILAMSRAMGEAAPLIIIGAAGYISFLPESITDSFTVLPIQIFNWTSRPQAEFQNIAAAGILVLMILLLSANAVAVIIRNKYEK